MALRTTNVLEDFTHKSGIRALSFAETSKTRVERIFWYLAIVVCVGLTIHDTYTSMELYISNPVATKITVTINETMDLGTPTVCVEMDHFPLMPTFMNDTEAVLSSLKSVGNLTDFLSTTLSTIRSSRLSGVDGIEAVAMPNTSVLDIMGILTVVLSSVVRAEHFVHIPLVSYNYTWGYQRRSKIYTQDGERHIALKTEASEVVTFVALFLSQNNYSLADIHSLVGEFWCHKMLFIAKTTKLYHSIPRKQDACTKDRISWFGPQPFNVLIFDLLCIRMQHELFLFYNKDDVAAISFDLNQLYLPNEDSNEFVYVNFARGLQGEQVVLPRSQNVFGAETRARVSVNIQIQGVVQRYKMMSDCSGESALTKCKFDCRLRYMVDQCGCIPLSLARSIAKDFQNLSVCGSYRWDLTDVGNKSIPGFYGCPVIRELNYPNTDCNAKCLSNCRATVLTFQIVPRTDTTFINKSVGHSHLSIHADTFSFFLIEEISLYGIRELVGFLGGNLSFYLGINFLMLIHTIFYWVQVPFWLKRSPKRMKDEQPAIRL